MSFPIKPSKRPYDRNPLEPNGRGKWQKSASFHPPSQPLKVPPGSTVFRVLCPSLKTGSVIGKGGAVVNRIRQETGAKIKVEEAVPGCSERIIVIAGSDKEARASDGQNKADDESDDAADDTDDAKENDESKDDEEGDPSENFQSEKATSSAQKALLLIFERMVEIEPEGVGEDDANQKSEVFVRLLVLSSQVGCILGKGGCVIKRLTAESGAQIRVLPRDKLPSCASPFDEVVQITGGLDAVRKALQLVSQQLLDNPPRDADSFPPSKLVGPSSHPFAPLSQPEVYPPANYPFPVQGAPYALRPRSSTDFHPSIAPAISKFHETESFILGRMRSSPEILTFRLLCTDDKIGGVIGKGGSIIKALHHETGCDIKIPDAVSNSDDRVIIISGPALPDDRISAVQDAVLRVQSRILRPVPDNKEKTLSSKILVSSSHIGCLLGKGGAIIAEMRKVSGAHIRILGKDQIPKCALENEEVVQILGEFEAVQEAMLQITSRLQHHILRDKFPAMSHPSHSTFPDHLTPFPPYMGRRDLSPPRIHSNLGPFHQFDGVGGLPHHDERSAFAHGIHRPGIPSQSSERFSSSMPWAAQGTSDGGGPIGVSNYAGGAPQRRTGGIEGGRQPAFVTSTTVEVVVPRTVVPSIYGEDGSCLKQIREISGAEINITEPKPGATETVIIIAGTPEQTHAAQSLLQAFVMSDTASP